MDSVSKLSGSGDGFTFRVSLRYYRGCRVAITVYRPTRDALEAEI